LIVRKVDKKRPLIRGYDDVAEPPRTGDSRGSMKMAGAWCDAELRARSRPEVGLCLPMHPDIAEATPATLTVWISAL
jgi:hypothetical protein